MKKEKESFNTRKREKGKHSDHQQPQFRKKMEREEKVRKKESRK